MTTDYLETQFPPYTRTEDTSVLRFKPYFRKVGTAYLPVLGILESDNPKFRGWYEFTSNHNNEFQFNVDSLCVNNVSDQCHSFLIKLQTFPAVTLPRETTLESGITLDWTGTFVDTKWSETIGQLIAPDYIVPFSTNLYIAENINSLIDKYGRMGATRRTKVGWETLRSTFEAFDAAILPGVDGSYLENGYEFDPTTLGSETRTKDVYTLASYWEEIDFRVLQSMLQDSIQYLTSLFGMEDMRDMAQRILDASRKAARVIVDLAKRTNNMEITDMNEVTVTNVTVPGTITVDDVDYYRLNSKQQLVAGKIYGLLVYNNDGSIEIFNPEVVNSPESKFDYLELPEAWTSVTTEEIDVPVQLIRTKKIWFTTVPFKGS